VSEPALSAWMRTLVAYVRSGQPDLTNRQMGLLLLVYLTPGPHTVRGLATLLGVSKPVVTRALNTLGALGYRRRRRTAGQAESPRCPRALIDFGSKAPPARLIPASMRCAAT
jgi:hypothetical protein